MALKLAISNIAWTQAEDREMYGFLRSYGLEGLEIAPTRLFAEAPYEKKDEMALFAKQLLKEYGLTIPSMQSIWYGRTEKIFGSCEDRKALLEYTYDAIDFAELAGIGNLVFGCPKNRCVNFMDDYCVAVDFFRNLGNYAQHHNTVVALEPNPEIYGTNFINTTEEAIRLIADVKSEGFKLNLDLGTMVYNNESLDVIKGHENYINHVHISEPYLKTPVHRELHVQLRDYLSAIDYKGFVSIEMGNGNGIADVKDTVQYVHSLLR